MRLDDASVSGSGKFFGDDLGRNPEVTLHALGLCQVVESFDVLVIVLADDDVDVLGFRVLGGVHTPMIRGFLAGKFNLASWTLTGLLIPGLCCGIRPDLQESEGFLSEWFRSLGHRAPPLTLKCWSLPVSHHLSSECPGPFSQYLDQGQVSQFLGRISMWLHSNHTQDLYTSGFVVAKRVLCPGQLTTFGSTELFDATSAMIKERTRITCIVAVEIDMRLKTRALGEILSHFRTACNLRNAISSTIWVEVYRGNVVSTVDITCETSRVVLHFACSGSANLLGSPRCLMSLCAALADEVL